MEASSAASATGPFPGPQDVAVDYHNDARVPLLFLSGGEDHLMPPAVQQSNLKHYKSNTITEIKEFAGRSHLMPAQKGWEEVADYALTWAVEHATRPWNVHYALVYAVSTAIAITNAFFCYRVFVFHTSGPLLPEYALFCASYAFLIALHQGTLRAQDAFARGALKVRGRPELLAAHGELLAALERVLARLRAETTPPESVRADR